MESRLLFKEEGSQGRRADGLPSGIYCPGGESLEVERAGKVG